MLERKYGGHIKVRHAALVIQQAYRKHCMEKQFQNIRSAKSTRRLSHRYFSMREPSLCQSPMIDGRAERAYVCREYTQNFVIVERNEQYVHHNYRPDHNVYYQVEPNRGGRPHRDDRPLLRGVEMTYDGDKINKNNSSSAVVSAIRRSVSKDRLRNKGKELSKDRPLDELVSPPVERKQKRSRSKDRKSMNYIGNEQRHQVQVTSPQIVVLKTRSKSLDRHAASVTRRQRALSPPVVCDNRRGITSALRCDTVAPIPGPVPIREPKTHTSKSKERSRSKDRHKQQANDSLRAQSSGQRTVTGGQTSREHADLYDVAPPIPKHSKESRRARASSLDESLIVDELTPRVAEINLSNEQPKPCLRENRISAPSLGVQKRSVSPFTHDLTKSESDENLGYENRDVTSPAWGRKGTLGIPSHMQQVNGVSKSTKRGSTISENSETDSLDGTTYSSSPTSDSALDMYAKQTGRQSLEVTSSSNTFRLSDVERKRQYRVGLNLFNK